MRCSHFHSMRRIRLIAISMLLPWSTACDLGLGLDGPYDLETRDVTVNVTGRVTAANDGTPLAGVMVQPAYSYGVRAWETGVTDSHGDYTMTVESSCFVAAESCLGPSLVAYPEGWDPGFEPQSKDVGNMESSGAVLNTVLDFSLRPTRPITVRVHGQVAEGSTGGGIEGALITVRDQWARLSDIPFDSTFTDSGGMYSVAIADHCGMTGDTCSISFDVWAEKDNRLQVRSFDNLNVSGDSLAVLANFPDLR